MKVFAIAMQKGGVGKTALTTNVAAVLADLQHRVLVVDADAQGHQAQHFGIRLPEGKPRLDAVLFDRVSIREAALEVRDRLHLVPAGEQLASADLHLGGKPDGLHRLAEALEPVAEFYDYVLIDCPPNLGMLTLNALACAARPIVPVQTEQAAADSLRSFFATCASVRKRLNTALQDPWLVPSMYQAGTIHQREILGYLRGNPLGCAVLEPIRRTIKIAEAFALGKPVYEHDRMASDGYERVAERIVAHG